MGYQSCAQQADGVFDPRGIRQGPSDFDSLLAGIKKKESSDMAKSKLVKANQKIAEGVVGGYRKIEEGVVGGYKKIEKGAVSGFNKMTDKFVDHFLTKEGESVEEAKVRMAAEQKAREKKSAAEREERRLKQVQIVEADKQKTEAAGMEAKRKAGLEL